MPGSGPSRLAGRLDEVAGRLPLALTLLVLAGLALRIALSLAYAPTYAHSYDSLLYVDVAGGELFSDATRTVGYPLFLRAVHLLSANVELTIQFQHVLGLVTAILLYATARRLCAPVWAGLIAAAAVLLSLDQIFLEHILMAEAPYAALLAAALYAAVCSLDEPRLVRGAVTSRHLWLLATGAALGLAAWIRPIAVPVAVFACLWIALAMPGNWRARLGRAALTGAATAAVVLSYFALSAANGGEFGFGTSSGWALYSRSAPFADCERFDPPAGTAELCERTPVDERNGPDFYGWQPDSPAQRLYGPPPAGDDELSAFAGEAITHQPLSYAKVVARDFVRYFHPAFSPQDFSGLGYDEFDVTTRLPIEGEILASIGGYYDEVELRVGDTVDALGEIQGVIRVHPKLMLLALLLAFAGIWLGRGRVRAGLVLMLGFFLISLLVPPATSIWSARYAIPVQGIIVAAGAIGAWVVAQRVSDSGPAEPGGEEASV